MITLIPTGGDDAQQLQSAFDQGGAIELTAGAWNTSTPPVIHRPTRLFTNEPPIYLGNGYGAIITGAGIKVGEGTTNLNGPHIENITFRSPLVVHDKVAHGRLVRCSFQGADLIFSEGDDWNVDWSVRDTNFKDGNIQAHQVSRLLVDGGHHVNGGVILNHNSGSCIRSVIFDGCEKAVVIDGLSNNDLIDACRFEQCVTAVDIISSIKSVVKNNHFAAGNDTDIRIGYDAQKFTIRDNGEPTIINESRTDKDYLYREVLELNYVERNANPVAVVDGTTDPDVSGYNYFSFYNTTATEISNFAGRVYTGKKITCLFYDTNTIIQHGAGIVLKSGADEQTVKKSVKRFEYLFGKWNEQ